MDKNLGSNTQLRVIYRSFVQKALYVWENVTGVHCLQPLIIVTVLCYSCSCSSCVHFIHVVPGNNTVYVPLALELPPILMLSCD